MKKNTPPKPREDWMLALLALRRDYSIAEVAEMLNVSVIARTVSAWLAGEYRPIAARRRQLVQRAEKHVPTEYKRLKAAERKATEDV